MIGCAGNFTYAQRDDALTQAFASHRFPEGFRYYFLGRPNIPYAIVGLEPGYTLANRFYRPVTEVDRSMERLVDALWETSLARPGGAHIVDLQGRRMGVWYSSAPLVSFQVDPETREVSIFSDEPWRRESNF
jgi:hypothetical protein